MRKLGLVIVGAAIVAVVVAGGLYYGLAVYPKQRFQAALDQSLRQLPADYVASYKTADYSLSDNRATLTGVSIKHEGAQSFDVSIDEIALEKPALDLMASWSKAAANPTALAPDQALPVVAAIDVRGLAVHAKLAAVTKDGTQPVQNLDATIEHAHVDGARLYPWALLHPDIPPFGEALAALQAAGPQPKPGDFLPLLRIEASLVLGFGYDGYTIDNVQETVKVEPAGATPAMSWVYNLHRITSAGIDRGVVKDARFEGGTIDFSAAIPVAVAGAAPRAVPIAGTFGIDHLSLAETNARAPLGQIIAGEPLAATMLDGLAIGRIEYGGLTLKLANTPTPIALGSIALSDIAFLHGMPVSGRFAWDGVRLSRTLPNPQFAAILTGLGLDTLTISLEASYRWDVEQKRMAIRDTTLKIDELGALDLSSDLADVAFAQGQPLLAHALLHYHDATLTERTFRLAAAPSHTDPAAFRQQLITTIRQEAAGYSDNPAMAAIYDAAMAFLNAPGSLTIELSPPSPVSLVALRSASALPPPQLQSLIGLSVMAGP
jgi:hypothetical protein